MSYGRFNLFGEVFHNFVATIFGVFGANVSGNGETRRHGHAQKVHFGKVGAFAAEQVPHFGITFGFAVAEGVDSFCFGTHNNIVVCFIFKVAPEVLHLRRFANLRRIWRFVQVGHAIFPQTVRKQADKR